MGRIVSIDYGIKRIGLAVSDERKVMAIPLIKLDAKRSPAANVDLILSATSSYKEIDAFLIGLPLHMSGLESPMSTLVRSFKTLLEARCSCPVILRDERLTSKQAEGMLIARDMKRKARTQVLDILSATLILQDYLDSQHLDSPSLNKLL